MIAFLHLCFSWTFVVALVLVTAMAFLDLLYDNEKYAPLHYPEHPRVQMTIYLMLAAIFVLWQMPLFLEENHLVEILIARLVIILAWLCLARFLLKWFFYGLYMLIVHWIFNSMKRNLST